MCHASPTTEAYYKDCPTGFESIAIRLVHYTWSEGRPGRSALVLVLIVVKGTNHTVAIDLKPLGQVVDTSLSRGFVAVVLLQVRCRRARTSGGSAFQVRPAITIFVRTGAGPWLPHTRTSTESLDRATPPVSRSHRPPIASQGCSDPPQSPPTESAFFPLRVLTFFKPHSGQYRQAR